MKLNRCVLGLICLSSFVVFFLLGQVCGRAAVDGQKPKRGFEIRTDTKEEGKLDALLARFRDHTTKLFEKHGMTNIGYWVPQNEPKSKNTLIYVVAHESREAATKNWDAFRNDADWKKVQSESE